MTVRHAALLTIALALLACTSAAEWGTRAERELGVGDHEAAAETLRRGLEAHPDDLELLLIAGEMYLSPVPAATYKPRLALHYALRADREAAHQDKRATSLLTRAYRATGGSPLGDEVVRRGLEQVGHKDATAPKRLDAADPDLLELTTANLREQARRDAAREAGETPCRGEFVHVPEGSYPAPGGTDVNVEEFCVSRAGTSSPGCPGARPCSEGERLLACTSLGAVLGDDPGCADAGVDRCCADPAIADPGATLR